MSDEVDRYTAAVHRRDIARLVRFAFALAVVAMIVLLALDNRDDARIGYLWGDATFPLWAVIVASAVGGVLIGGLLRFRSRQHRS